MYRSTISCNISNRNNFLPIRTNHEYDRRASKVLARWGGHLKSDYCSPDLHWRHLSMNTYGRDVHFEVLLEDWAVPTCCWSHRFQKMLMRETLELGRQSRASRFSAGRLCGRCDHDADDAAKNGHRWRYSVRLPSLYGIYFGGWCPCCLAREDAVSDEGFQGLTTITTDHAELSAIWPCTQATTIVRTLYIFIYVASDVNKDIVTNMNTSHYTRTHDQFKR